MKHAGSKTGGGRKAGVAGTVTPGMGGQGRLLHERFEHFFNPCVHRLGLKETLDNCPCSS